MKGHWRDSRESLSLKQVQSLQLRAVRDEHGLYLVEGLRYLHQCLDLGFDVRQLIVCNLLLKNRKARKLARKLTQLGAPTLYVSPKDFKSLCRAPNPQGLMLVLRQYWRSLDSISAHSQDCWLGLRKVRSPGNLGSLLRTAAAVGARGLVCLGGELDPFDPAVVRASMAANLHLEFVRSHHRGIQEWKQAGLLVFGSSAEGAIAYDKARRHFRGSRPIMLMLGEERRGMNEAELSLCDKVLSIPMTPFVDSLNLAVAASLLLYEIHRWQAQSRDAPRRNAFVNRR